MTASPDEELRLLIMKLARRIRCERSDESIADNQLSVLGALAQEPRGPSELAASERVTPPAMTRTINALEARGLVERRSHGDDARRVEVMITASGRDLLEKTRRLRTEWFTERLRALDPHERSTLDSATVILRRLLEED